VKRSAPASDRDTVLHNSAYSDDALPFNLKFSCFTGPARATRRPSPMETSVMRVLGPILEREKGATARGEERAESGEP
jgi:hypothetical protein